MSERRKGAAIARQGLPLTGGPRNRLSGDFMSEGEVEMSETEYQSIDKALRQRWLAAYRRANDQWSEWLPWDQSGLAEAECLYQLCEALRFHRLTQA